MTQATRQLFVQVPVSSALETLIQPHAEKIMAGLVSHGISKNLGSQRTQRTQNGSTQREAWEPVAGVLVGVSFWLG